MKKILVIGLMLGAALASQAQGVINFSSAASGVNAKFQTSAQYPGGAMFLRSTNSTFVADLFYTLGSSTVGIVSDQLTSAAGFNQGFTTSAATAQYGFFSGGSKTLTTVPGGTAIVAQVRVWDTAFGASYAAARVALGGSYFESPLFVITPATVPPGTPPNLLGLGNPAIYSLSYNAIPEPSSMALAGLGAASLLIFRRRK